MKHITMKYRPPRKNLSEAEIRSRLAKAYCSRLNYIEHLQTIYSGNVTPLILALCHTTIEDEISACKERIAYFDDAIKDLKSRLNHDVSIYNFIG